MNNLVLKCWNGIYGCSCFEVIGWPFKNLDEAGKYYKEIWPYYWAEDEEGNIIKKF